MNIKQNFFDQLDGGWDEVIADTYKEAMGDNILFVSRTKTPIEYNYDYYKLIIPDDVTYDALSKIKIHDFSSFGCDWIEMKIDASLLSADKFEIDSDYVVVSLFFHYVEDHYYKIELYINYTGYNCEGEDEDAVKEYYYFNSYLSSTNYNDAIRKPKFIENIDEIVYADINFIDKLVDNAIKILSYNSLKSYSPVLKDELLESIEKTNKITLKNILK